LLTGTGHSDICNDTNFDGFCDTNYTIGTNNIDYLPLAPAIEITIQSPTNKFYDNETIYLNASASGVIDTWWYSNDSGTNNNTFTPNQEFSWEEGSNTVIVWANHTSYNASKDYVIFIVDTIYPDINITYPSNNTNTKDTKLNINYTRNDTHLNSCWYSNDTYAVNTTLASCVNITGINWTEGEQNVTIWVNDSANNINSSLIIFTIDTNPNINISSPSNNTNSSDNMTDINYTTSDFNISTCWYSNDTYAVNTTLASCVNITSVNWTEGYHNVSIWVNDSANNINSSFVAFTIDITPPNMNISSPLNHTNTTDTTLNINYTHSDINIDTCWYSNDTYVLNTTLASCGNITSVTWEIGQHNITIWANDSSGNINYSFVRFTIESPPATNATTPGGGGGGAIVRECETNEDCEEGYSCYNYTCIKFFDVKIIKVDSPIKLGQFFNFTYFIKGMADINGDVVIDFWVEKNNEKITSGFDTLYFGSFEEKTEETQLFFPENINEDVYDFYVQASYGGYNAKALRTIQAKKEIKQESFSSQRSGELIYYIIIFITIILLIRVLIIYIKLKRKSNSGFLKIMMIVGFGFGGIVFLSGNKITGNVIGYSISQRVGGMFYLLLVLLFLGLILFLHRKNIKIIIENKQRSKNVISNLKGLIKKKVYTDDGEYIGKVVNVFLEDYKVESLKIKLDKRFNRRQILLKYKYVRDIGHIVIINQKILEKLKS